MSIHRLCEAARTGAAFPRFGDGTQIREFTYVDDIVAGNLAAASADVAPGTFCNLAGGGEITLNALIALVGELAGQPVAIDEQPAMPGDAFRNGGAIDKARALLGWEPSVSLRDGIAAQLAWHRTRAGASKRTHTRRSPRRTVTARPAMATRSPPRRTRSSPPRAEHWLTRRSVPRRSAQYGASTHCAAPVTESSGMPMRGPKITAHDVVAVVVAARRHDHCLGLDRGEAIAVGRHRPHRGRRRPARRA